MGALGTPVVRTDAASIWATGVTWWQVPKVAKVMLTGNLSPGVTGKDVIIALCGLFNKDEVLNHAVEFLGDGVAKLPMSARMTIANMTTEWGTLAGVFPFDEVTVNYMRSRVAEFSNPNRPGKRGPKSRSGYANADIDKWWKDRATLSADADAEYAIELELDLAVLVGQLDPEVDEVGAVLLALARHHDLGGEDLTRPGPLHEPHLVGLQAADTDIVGDRLGQEPRGEHPMAEHTREPGGLRLGLVVVHRVEVAGRARVHHQVGTGELVGHRRRLVTLAHVLEEQLLLGHAVTLVP